MRSRVLVLLLVLVAVSAAEPYTFTLDGATIVPRRLDLGDGPHPGPGDLVWIAGWCLPLDEAGSYAFSLDEKRGLLRTPATGGQPYLVGAAIAAGREGKIDNPLLGLTRDDLRRLRSLQINGGSKDQAVWSGTGPDPADLDWSRLYLELRLDYTVKDLPIPAAAAEAVRFLEIRHGVTGNRVQRDISHLATGTELRFLKLQGSGAAPISGAWIAKHTQLRHLDISGGTLTEVQALGGLGQLRELQLREIDGALDLGFAARLLALTSADLSRTGATSLDALLGLPRLTALRADSTPIAALPARACPALRRLDVVGSAIPEAAMQAFRMANPTLRIMHRWTDGLQDLAARSDRLVLRTGGTCHRDPKDDRILFETRDRDAIRLVLASLAIDEAASGGACMCCGSPSLEFHAGGAELATLGLHHGIGLRWSGADAPWPGDAQLTGAGSDSLCAWLAEHGDDGPLREWRQMKLRQQSEVRMLGYYQDILGEARLARLRQARGKPEVLTLLAESQPRAATLLRLYGCGTREWNSQWGLDDLIEEELKTAGAEVAAVAAALVASPEGADGLARWCFWLANLDDLPEATRTQVGPQLAARALADPRPENRRTVVIGLDRCRDAWATAALRTALAGLPARPLNPAEEVDPAGQVCFKPRSWDPPAKAGLRALAGLALARRGDAASRADILARRDASTGDDRAALDTAAGLLAAGAASKP